MNSYAYLDKQGILRIVSKEETAKQVSVNGKVVETDARNKNGTPTLFNKTLKVEEEVWIYGIFRAYWSPREEKKYEVKLKDYPELMDLFNLYRRLI